MLLEFWTRKADITGVFRTVLKNYTIVISNTYFLSTTKSTMLIPILEYSI